MSNPDLLPNFLLIGANKAGTTSLHIYLSEHPEIFMTDIKEPMFFYNWGKECRLDRDERDSKIAPQFLNNIEEYQALFLESNGYKVRGESSTAYLAEPACAAKIKQLIPQIKIIAVLRNPVDRAFSGYLMYKGWGYEKQSFEQSINEEIKKGKSSYPLGMRYLFLGKYADPLKTYFSLFSPGQVRIYLYEDFKADPKSFMKNVFEYLGVDATFVPDTNKRYNNSYGKRYTKKPAVDKMFSFFQRGFRKLRISRLEEIFRKHRYYTCKEEVRKKLIDYYADEISELEELLNRDLSAWRK